MIMAVSALLSEVPDATDEQVLDGLVNNLCRCTGYQKIREAVGTLTQATVTQRSEAARG
jgi:carbon-monoxide dehydrogenase small subunit